MLFKKKRTTINNPTIDKKVDLLYEQYLRKAGHCPKCNDYLFITIKKYEEYYIATKHCISHTCDYEIDITNDFNKDLGITPPKQSKYYNRLERNAFGYRSFPKNTGTNYLIK